MSFGKGYIPTPAVWSDPLPAIVRVEACARGCHTYSGSQVKHNNVTYYKFYATDVQCKAEKGILWLGYDKKAGRYETISNSLAESLSRKPLIPPTVAPRKVSTVSQSA